MAHFQFPEWIAKIIHLRMAEWRDPSLESLKRFLNPSLKDLPDPFSLPDMEIGADRLAEAIVEKHSIAIYGDYDVDGTVGASVLYLFLKSLGLEARVYQPDRHREGYGINGKAIETLAAEGVQLLIAVDCGITSVKEVELANSLGMDVMICDHHEPKEILPPALAVIDHKRADYDGPIQSLSGAGVAFYLAMATRSVLRDIEFFEEQKEPDLRELLDLVALATVADMVPLVDENRILLKAGLDKLKRSPNLGLRELLAVAKVEPKDVTTYHFGFVIGPRINAAGRLGSANAAFELLTATDPKRARELAESLNAVNFERMDLQAQIAAEAVAQAQALVQANPMVPALVVASDEWNEGVIGIVASRLVEKFQRPAAVITFATHTGKGKGSLRSFGGIDLMSCLDASAEHLIAYGGHKAAAGLSLESGRLEGFRESFEASVAQATETILGGPGLLTKETKVDCEVSDTDITEESVKILEKLAPFGMGNPEPNVISSGWKVSGVRTLKERHLKLQLQSNGTMIEGFWANGVDSFRGEVGSEVELAVFPQINTFRDVSKIELKIKDVRIQ